MKRVQVQIFSFDGKHELLATGMAATERVAAVRAVQNLCDVRPRKFGRVPVVFETKKWSVGK